MARVFARLWRRPTGEPGVTQHFGAGVACPEEYEAEAEAAGVLEPVLPESALAEPDPDDLPPPAAED